jgi:hypothetical protein
MAAVRRLTTSALFFTALAVATTACGTSGGGTHPPAASLSPTAVADPLAGWNAQRIEKQSATDTLAARYVRITGTGTDSGQQVTFDLTMVVGVGCRGTISEHGIGSFLLISKGNTVWIQPDAAFWKQEAGQNPSTSQQLLEQLFAGKYLEDKAGTGLGSLASMCSLHSLFGSSAMSAPNTPLKKAGTAVIDGQRRLKLISTDAKQPGYAYVSDTAKPEILQMTAPGPGGGSLSFTYYATAPAITPPPASESIDGSKYGF